MNESYQTERQMNANALAAELVYMEKELAKIKESGAYKDYTALMRTYLATQKSYMKIIAEIEQDETETDELLAFTAGA